MNEQKRPKLLLADDSGTIRKVVELTFSDEGIEVTTASDAESAMLKFVEIQPDIVLVDVGMEGTNGYRICEMIKQDEATRHIPVMLLVGSFEPFDQDEAERVGCDGFLTKPFHSIRDLVTRVWDLLGRERRAAAIAVETADIEDLYKSSFGETMKMEEFDTAEDIFGDSGMDDEMIEASYPKETSNGDAVDVTPEPEMGRETKEFDWSPESMVIETETAPPQASPSFEPKFVFDESSEPEAAPIEDPHEVQTATHDEIDVSEPSVNSNEPSPELISILTQRIVERLSDRVIREIAQDAVPRIAEKLIREALEEDKKG